LSPDGALETIRFGMRLPSSSFTLNLRFPKNSSRHTANGSDIHAVVTEDEMKTLSWSSIIQGLVLVRIGQELGTESQLARAVHDVVAAVLAFWP
jgi:hypothetical protein